MILYGYVVDSKTNAPLPGTTVTINDANGIWKGITTTTNSNGFFQVNNPIVIATDKFIFTRAEYYSSQATAQGIYDASFFDAANGALISMQQKITELDPVVITSSPKKNNTGLLIAGGLLLFALADEKKKKSVGKINVYNYYKGLPPIAKGIVVVGGGLIAYLTLNKLLKAAPPDAGEPNAAGEALNVLASQGTYPTYTQAQYEGFANAIVQAVWDCGTDEDAIYNVMQSLQNDADVLKLIQVYGIREYKGCFENFFSLVSRSLTATLSSELDASEKREVNNILKSKGITYQFV
jgi:hypothetical protein